MARAVRMISQDTQVTTRARRFRGLRVAMGGRLRGVLGVERKDCSGLLKSFRGLNVR